jgi:hypothetical protein
MYMYTYVDIHTYIYITQPTPKFAKHTRCEQVDRDVNIPHPKPCCLETALGTKIVVDIEPILHRFGGYYTWRPRTSADRSSRIGR